MTKYSKTGEYHRKNNIANQDFVFVRENEECAFYAVADGVSSCENSAEGAKTACAVAAKVIMSDVDYFFEINKETVIAIVISNIRKRIVSAADAASNDPISYASTLCFICIRKKTKQVMTFTLGDSRVYVIDRDCVSRVSVVRSHGEDLTCSTMTIGAETDAMLEINDRTEGKTYFLCTDGCWRELFIKDADGKTAFSKLNLHNIADYLESKTISDDCSFLMIT